MSSFIFLGKFYSHDLLRTIKVDTKGRAGFSDHNFEMSLIDGLKKNISGQFVCITSPIVYSFPHNNRRFFIHGEAYEDENALVYSIPFCNLIVVNRIWKKYSLVIRLLKSFRKCSSEIKLIVNTADNTLLSAVKLAKRLTRKRVETIVIIPDIPFFVNNLAHYNPIKRFLLDRMDRNTVEAINHCNKLVLLTEQMMDFFDKDLPYLVMEGLCGDSMTRQLRVDEQGTDYILYTGTLASQYGILNLLEAFEEMNNKDVELWICGSGNSVDEIRRRADKNERIKFLGLIDSASAIKLQSNAKVLVNSRTSEGEFTKYSFPSKTLEYLLSGKPVVINKLPGIPEDYYEYVFTPESESVKDLAVCLDSVLSMSDEALVERGIKGRVFVLQEKNAARQVKRILDFIDYEQI